jgi:hypothetical protein
MYATTRSQPVGGASSDNLVSSDVSVAPSVVGGSKAPGARRLCVVAFGGVAPGNGDVFMAQGATPVTVEGGGSAAAAAAEEAPSLLLGKVGRAEAPTV